MANIIIDSRIPVIVSQLCPDCWREGKQPVCRKCKSTGLIHSEMNQNGK